MARYTNDEWPRRLYIVRHGQSAGNVARDAAETGGLALIDLEGRDADTPLSTVGQQQAAALGQWFLDMGDDAPSVFLSSPFIRSLQTIDAVASALGAAPETIQADERLREKEFGILDRYTKLGIQSTFPALAAQRALVGKFYFRPPGGESWCDVVLRVRSLVEELRRDYAGQRVVIVSHQVVVNCFRYLLERLDERAILAIDRESDVPNCGVTEYGFVDTGRGRGFGLLRANVIAPLVAQGTPVTKAPDRPVGPK